MDHQDAYEDPYGTWFSFLGTNVQEGCENFYHSLLRTCLMSKSTGLMSNSTIQSLVATNSDGYRLMYELVALARHERPSPLLLHLHDLRRVCALRSVTGEGMMPSDECKASFNAFMSNMTDVEMSEVIHVLSSASLVDSP
jgi:hypothetical protein